MNAFSANLAFRDSILGPTPYGDEDVVTTTTNEVHDAIDIQKAFSCAFGVSSEQRDEECSCAYCKWRYTLAYTKKKKVPTLYSDYSTILKLTHSSYKVFINAHDPVNTAKLQHLQDKQDADTTTDNNNDDVSTHHHPYNFSIADYSISAADALSLYHVDYDMFLNEEEYTDSEGEESEDSTDDENYYHYRNNPIHQPKRRRVEPTDETHQPKAQLAEDESVYTVSEGVQRLLAFKKVLFLMASAPWTSHDYKPNMRVLDMMVASHLKFIVGEKAYNEEKSTLYTLITDEEDFSKLQNILVITNRQNGKTTMQSIMIAALSIMSPTGGDLICVYSLSLHRAQEITTSAKGYIIWFMDEHISIFKQMGLPIPRILTNNITTYKVVSAYKNTNLIKACPSTVEANRGDRPHIIFYDEFGFAKGKMVTEFTLPLLQQRDRLMSCFTTPPPPTEHCHGFIEKIRAQNKTGVYFFTLVNHTLVCDKCIDADTPDDCVHHLYMVPPWKSVGRYREMLDLYSEKDRISFHQEMYGVSKDFRGFYLPKSYILPSIVNRSPFALNLIDAQCPVIYIATDPASHERSFMGIIALTYSASDERTSGKIGILGLSNVANSGVDSTEVNKIMSNFTHCLLQSEWVQQARCYEKPIYIVPITECNHSDSNAMTINNGIECGMQKYNRTVPSQYRVRMCMPFLKDVFRCNITAGVGVWTRDSNKEAAIQYIYSLLKENRIHFAKKCVTVNFSADKIKQPPLLKSVRDEFALQLGNLRRDEKNAVTGKTGNSEDDLAMSALIGFYWSMLIRNTEFIEKLMAKYK